MRKRAETTDTVAAKGSRFGSSGKVIQQLSSVPIWGSVLSVDTSCMNVFVVVPY